MKKITSLVAAALVTCSLSACGNRNTTYRTPGTNQGGTNIGMNQGNYNAGVNTTAYRDGVYLGEGNRSSMGNQAAIVTVRGGRITDVVLKTIDAQGKETSYTGGGNGTGTNLGGTTTGTTGGTNVGTNNGVSNGGGTTTGSNTGWGNVTGGTVGGNPVGGSNAGTTGRTPAGGTVTGGTNINGSPTGGTAAGGSAGGAITGRNTTDGTTVTTNLERVRRDLANAVVSQQTYNVNVANAGSDATSVNNWKLAISRALDSARR